MEIIATYAAVSATFVGSLLIFARAIGVKF